MKAGIVGLTCSKNGNGLRISRCYGGITQEFTATTFEEAGAFLLEVYPGSLYATWNVKGFGSDLCSLLPGNKRADLRLKSKTFCDDTKLFVSDRVIGLTGKKHIRDNFFQPVEVNIYGLFKWFPDSQVKPDTAEQIAELGERLLDTLALVGIDPDKLSSPVAVIADELARHDLPTVWSNESQIFEDACAYALRMSHYEWRQDFRSARQSYNLDMIAAYPFFIASLPDTDHCRIRHWKSESLIDTAEWGIMKGELEVTSDICPIPCQTTDGGYVFGVKGKISEVYITTDELRWLKRRKAGTFQMADGYFFQFLNDRKPYREVVNRLFQLRQTSNELLSFIIKTQAQGISGKLDQINNDGSYGELYNPVLAAMVRSRCRVAVADFVYDNDLQNDLVAVILDGIRTTRELELPQAIAMGNWRAKE